MGHILARALMPEKTETVEGFRVDFHVTLEEGKPLNLIIREGTEFSFVTPYPLLALFHLDRIRRVIELTQEYIKAVKEVK